MAFGRSTAFLKATLTGDVKGMRAALRQARSDVTSFAGSATVSFLKAQLAAVGIQTGIRGISNAISSAIGGVKDLTVSSVKEFASFEKGLLEVRTILSDTGAATADQQLQEIKETAKELALRFGKGPQDVIRGFYQAISAGATTAVDSTNVLNASLRLAQGGLTDTETAVDALTTVLNSFNLQSSSASKIADQFFTTVRLGKTTVGLLASSIGNVASQAAVFGLTTEEMFGALAGLTKAGVKTEIAITNLRAIIASLADDTGENTELARELGISWGAAALKTKGFSAIVSEINEAMKEDSTIIGKLFPNIRALGGAAILAGTGWQNFKESIDAVTSGMGAASDASEIMGGAMQTQLDRIAVGFDILKINVVEGFAEELKTAFVGVANSLTVLGNTRIPLAERMQQAWQIVETEVLPDIFRLWDRVVELWDANKGPILSFVGNLMSELGAIAKTTLTTAFNFIVDAISTAFSRLFSLIAERAGNVLADITNAITFDIFGFGGRELAGWGFQTGGYVQGRPGVDQNLARVSSGEFVLRREAVNAIGLANVQAMNQASPGITNQFDLRGTGITRSEIWSRIVPELERAIETGTFGNRRSGL